MLRHVLELLYGCLISAALRLQSFFTTPFTKRKDVQDQVVVITGASGGYGREMAKRFTEMGSKVVLLDINKQELEKQVAELENRGHTAVAFQCDVTDFEDLQEVETNIRNNAVLGPADIVICNAGILHVAPLNLTPTGKIRQIFEVNTLGCIWTIRAFLPSMIARGQGHICVMASGSALIGVSQLASYSASKFALRGLMESLEFELHDLGLTQGIKTTTIFPFFTATPMIEECDFKHRMGLLTTEEAVSGIVEAILRERRSAHIPFYQAHIATVLSLLPQRARLFVHRYMSNQMVSKSRGNLTPADVGSVVRGLKED